MKEKKNIKEKKNKKKGKKQPTYSLERQIGRKRGEQITHPPDCDIGYGEG